MGILHLEQYIITLMVLNGIILVDSLLFYLQHKGRRNLRTLITFFSRLYFVSLLFGGLSNCNVVARSFSLEIGVLIVFFADAFSTIVRNIEKRRAGGD